MQRVTEILALQFCIMLQFNAIEQTGRIRRPYSNTFYINFDTFLFPPLSLRPNVKSDGKSYVMTVILAAKPQFRSFRNCPLQQFYLLSDQTKCIYSWLCSSGETTQRINSNYQIEFLCMVLRVLRVDIQAHCILIVLVILRTFWLSLRSIWSKENLISKRIRTLITCREI